MKKTLLLSVFFLLLGLAPHAFAQGFVPLAGIPGLTQGVDASSGGLTVFFNNLYKYLIGLAGVFAVIEIIWGGLEIAVNKENVSKLTDAKGRIMQAIYGLILVLSPVLVFSIINPNILNLSLNLPKLDLTTATSTPGGPPPGITGTVMICGAPYTCEQEIAACSNSTVDLTLAYASNIKCFRSDGTLDPNGGPDANGFCAGTERRGIICTTNFGIGSP